MDSNQDMNLHISPVAIQLLQIFLNCVNRLNSFNFLNILNCPNTHDFALPTFKLSIYFGRTSL